jgi:hypothetical protein
LSGTVQAWLSDCLCRASTGDGSVKRALYTDHDVAVMAYRRCVFVNGVDLIVDRGDLAERVVVVDLRRVQTRRPEDELAEAWDTARPGLLGALLDLAAAVHERLPAIHVDDLPRMADFAKVLAAVDEVQGTEGLKRYRERSQRAAADTLDAPFIAELVTRRYSADGETSAELLTYLRPTAPDWRPPRGWPKNARAVTGLLTRHAPALRALGWEVDNDQGRNEQHATKWTVTPPEPEKAREPEKVGADTSSDSSTSSTQVNGINGDEVRGPDELETSYDEVRTSPGEIATSSEKVPSTSDNEKTSQTSHTDPPSLVLSATPGGLTDRTPGMTDRVRAIVAKQAAPAITVTGPGRCPGCSSHVPTQGHKPDCPDDRQSVIAKRLATLTTNGDHA